jgi:carbamoyl-phosphate synthase large subunit
MRLVVTSIGDKIPLLQWAREACVKTGFELVGVDRDPTCTGRAYVDAFVTELEDVGGYSALIPTRNGDVWALSGKPGVMAVDRPERFIDKSLFATMYTKMRLPRVMWLHEYPCVVKERFGAGGTARICRNEQEQLDAIEHMRDPIVQEYLRGPEYSCDAYYRMDGTLHGYVVRERLRVKHGESVVTEVTDDPGVNRLCGDYLHNLDGMRGHINMQLIGDKVIEINPRIGGASTCAFRAGLESIYWWLLEVRGREIPEMHMRHVRQTRIAHDVWEVA